MAGPLQEEADWRLVPAIHLSALVHCPGGAAPTGYPGYYDLDEEQIALYLQSAKDPAAWDDYLQKYVYQIIVGCALRTINCTGETPVPPDNKGDPTGRPYYLYGLGGGVGEGRDEIPGPPPTVLSPYPTLPRRRSPRRLRGAPPPGPGSSR